MRRIVLTLFFFMGPLMAAAAAETRTLNFTNFDQVSVGSGMHVSINQGESYRVEATGAPEALERLEMDQKGSRLEFWLDHGWTWWRRSGRISLDITLPRLRKLDLSGGSQGSLDIQTGSGSFSADLSGGSFLNGQLSCGNGELSLSGGSEVELSGSGEDLIIDGSGGSEYDLQDFPARNLNASLSGGSRAAVTLNGSLNADLSGGSEVVYYGNATMAAVSSSGGSKVRKGR